MKYRSGFVSNSSSSSFVIVGFRINEEKDIPNILSNIFNKDISGLSQDDIYNLLSDICYKDNDYVFRTGSDDGIDGTIFGVEIADSDNSYLNPSEHKISDLLENMENIKNKANVKSPVLLLTGTRCC